MHLCLLAAVEHQPKENIASVLKRPQIRINRPCSCKYYTLGYKSLLNKLLLALKHEVARRQVDINGSKHAHPSLIPL